MTSEPRPSLLQALARRRAGLLATTALLALLVPPVASAPIRAIPALTGLVAGTTDSIPLSVVVPFTGAVELGLTAFLAVLVALGLLAAACSLAQGALVARLNATLAADVRERLVERLLRQPPSYHQHAGPGALLGPLTADAEMIALHLGNLVPAAFGILSGLVAWSLTLASGLDASGMPVGAAAGLLGAILGTLGGANLLAAWMTGRRTGESQKQAQAARDEALGALTETLDAVAEIQTHAAEEAETLRVAERVREMARRQQVVARWGALGNALTQVVVVAALPAVVVAATLLGASAEALAVVLPSLAFLQAAIASAVGLWTQIKLTRPSIDRVGRLLAETPSIRDAEGARAPERVDGAIRFERVTFRYPEAERPVLDGFDLEIPPGRTVALVGDGGSGKSTLLQLLVRFRDPGSGTVRLDGRDVREIPLRELRRRVGLLAQHARLFARSARENLTLGAPDASAEDLAAACRTAHAEPVLAKIPGGLEGRVDPGAANLSGSERRRLALARVLARRPAVLLLDEPEAGLPQALAERLMADLREAMRGRTCLVVTHRPDLLATDLVVFLEHGRVGAVGSHAELERTCDPYRRLLAQRLEAAEGGEPR